MMQLRQHFKQPFQRFQEHLSRVAGVTRCLPFGIAAMFTLANPSTAWADKSPVKMVGADISWVQEQEDKGIRFYDTGRKPEDIFTILKRHGFNAVRLRVFVNPRGKNGYSTAGYCDLQHTMLMAQRVCAAGMRLVVDLHYSDTWADPAHQVKPAAWEKLDALSLRKAVYGYTHDVVTALKKQNTPPDIVQVGNEITGGMLWPDGEMWKPGREQTFCNLVRSAIEAVRDASPQTRVMLHTATGGRNGDSRAFLDLLARNRVKFDILGLSYYPKFDGSPDRLRNNLRYLVNHYPQDIVVAEYTAPDQTVVHNIVVDLPKDRGLGTFIWEPTRWPMGNPALFDTAGRTKPTIREFDALQRIKPASAQPTRLVTQR